MFFLSISCAKPRKALLLRQDGIRETSAVMFWQAGETFLPSLLTRLLALPSDMRMNPCVMSLSVPPMIRILRRFALLLKKYVSLANVPFEGAVSETGPRFVIRTIAPSPRWTAINVSSFTTVARSVQAI